MLRAMMMPMVMMMMMMMMKMMMGFCIIKLGGVFDTCVIITPICGNYRS